jgi:D-amino-acid dehydrogenase
MRVCVIGAGVVGLTTAHQLLRDGHEVTVLERHAGAAREASYANGGQLSYNYVVPLAGTGVWRELPGFLLDAEAPLRFRPRLEPAFWRWCLQFAARCNVRDARATTTALLQLGALSRARLRGWVADWKGAPFAYRNNGKLVVYRNRKSFEAACEQMRFQRQFGSEHQALSVAECVAVEPALIDMAPRLVGGIYLPSEDVADSYAFCRALSLSLSGASTGRILFGACFERFIVSAGCIRKIVSSVGEVETDAVVVAAGIGSVDVLRLARIVVPLLGLKGYSITIRADAQHRAPQVSITDNHYKIVFAKLDDRLRVAGMVELGAADTRVDPARIATLARQARENFPQAGEYNDLHPWAGIRPATPSGRPIIDRLGYDNLFVNIGHGTLGFTLAMGSAELAADLVAGRRSSMDGALFRLANA